MTNYLTNFLTMPFAITNSTTSTSANINLAGTAPLEIKFLRFGNRTTNEFVIWLTVSNWSFPFSLNSGANNITVTGFDRFTNSIATNSTTITY
jgi:hypothetical protein